MDTTKTLKSRLRDRLARWHAEADLARKAADAERERKHDLYRDDELMRLGADRMRRVTVYIVLSRLAGDEEIGLLAAQLDERRPLKVTGSISPADDSVLPDSLPPVEWIIARPGRESPTLPQSIGDPLIVWDIVFDAVVPEWLDFLDAAAPSPDGLTPDARAFLTAMLDLRLYDGALAGQDAIWAKVAELGDAVEGKSNREAAIGILKDRKLIGTKSGTGTMLTTEGLTVARSLSSRSNSE